MANNRKHILHYRTSTINVTPSSDNLPNGEIAINDYAGEEKLFIKNSEGEIVSFNRVVVDTELNSGSTNPVENSAITKVILGNLMVLMAFQHLGQFNMKLWTQMRKNNK